MARIGLIGCGNISGIYLRNSKRFRGSEIVSCSDLVPERAHQKAKEHGIAWAATLDEMLTDPSIDTILNLTIPNAHASITLQALAAGKHVYSEKPLATTLEDGKRILDEANSKGLRVGCAPDTFLGAAMQTCRKLMDEGEIGTPVGASAFMTCRGHERWHPDPSFYYQKGGGPMLDMGPYYLTALVNLLGPIKRVTASTRITFSERIVSSDPHRGQRIPVEVPTHVSGVMDFESGAVGSILMSFDIWHSILPRLEVYGSEGTLILPDPNNFGGQVLLRNGLDAEWKEISLVEGLEDNGRGIGLADMTQAIEARRAHRASGELGFHVLEAMAGFHMASDAGRHVELVSRAVRPEPFTMEDSTIVT